MNSEVKAKWLEALRSGEYKQTRYTLRSGTNGFCCLGVLSDIYRKEVGGCSWERDCNEDDTWTDYSILQEGQNDSETVDLPDWVRAWAEVEDRNPQVHVTDRKDNNSEFVGLAELNDEGKTFNEIADLIEHQL
jgi:hypothetical protein